MSVRSHQGPLNPSLKEVRFEDFASSPTTYDDRNACDVIIGVRE